MQFLRKIFYKIYNWNEPNSNLEKSDREYTIHPFTLNFNKNLENNFQDIYHTSSINLITTSIILSMIVYFLFSIFDYNFVKDNFVKVFYYRNIIGIFIFTSTLVLINKLKKKKLIQPILSLTTAAMGILNIVFMVMASPELDNYYYTGNILIIMWAYILFRMQFIWALISGIIVFITYQVAVLGMLDFSGKLYIISSSNLLAANLIGLLSTYILEFYSRKLYYQRIILTKTKLTNENLNEKLLKNDKSLGTFENQLLIQNQALEAAANAIVILDKESRIIWCNPAMEKLTGYTRKELIGGYPNTLKSGKHDKEFYKNMWETVLRGDVWSGEVINRKRDGTLYTEQMVITPVKNNNEEIIRFVAIKQDITEQKKIEEQLKESEIRVSNFIENATLGIYRVSSEGNIIIANNALINMLGFDSVAQLKNRGLVNGGYKDKKEREKFVKLIEEKGKINGYESEWLKKDGSTIYIRESSRKITENGKIYYEGTVEDITFSKINEIKLKESNAKLRALFDNVYDAIFILDKNGNILEINDKVTDLYNISIDQAKKLNIKDISSANNDFAKLQKYWTDIAEKGKTYKFEWKAKRIIDDLEFDVEIYLSRILLGTENFILANIRDITDEKEANRNLLLTKKTVELNTTPIYWFNNKLEIIYANNSAVEQIGYGLEELYKMKFQDIIKENQKEKLSEWQNKSMQVNYSAKFEANIVKKTGENFFAEVNLSEISYENEKIIITLINDITEIKKTAKKLVLAKEQAEKSDKLKSEFLAGMSHEIRTPINTILNFISLIKSDIGKNMSEETSFSFQMINNGSKRLIRTIDSILNMSQFQAGSYDVFMEKIDLSRNILTPLVNEFKQTAKGKNLELYFENNANSSLVFADEYTLKQLFINLIDNAIKYTKKGFVKVKLNPDATYYNIDIEDTGIGMAKEFIPTLFQPFSQEEQGYTRSFEGNGLGLALVQKYIEINCGKISVESEKGKGTTFKIKLYKLN